MISRTVRSVFSFFMEYKYTPPETILWVAMEQKLKVVKGAKRRAPAPAATYSALILCGLILLPDIGNLFPETWTIGFSGKALSAPWAVWLCCQQLSLAGLCAWAAWGPRSRPVLIAGILWFTIQAVDELVAGNFFGAGLWEYPILLALFGITLYITRHERRNAP